MEVSGKNPKPLWGFGWAGWCLLAVALSLAGLMIAGVDVRHWIQARIIWNFGWRPTVWFTASFMPSHLLFDFEWMHNGIALPLSPPMMRFSLVTMCLVLVALQVHPRRTGALRIAGVVVMGVVVPGLTLSALAWLEPLWGLPPVVWRGHAFTVIAVASALLSVAVLTWATRSWRVGMFIAGVFIPAAYLISEVWRGSAAPAAASPLLMTIRGNETWFTALAWVWNPMLFACLMVWAIRARLRVRPPHCCQSCGYDLRGTPEGKCPECGAATESSAGFVNEPGTQ